MAFWAALYAQHIVPLTGLSCSYIKAHIMNELATYKFIWLLLPMATFCY